MFVFTYAAALLAVLYTTASIFLLFRTSPTPVTRLLAAYLFSSALWAGSNAAADVAYTTEAGILLGGFAFVAIGVNLICFLILVDILVNERFPSWERLLIFSIPNLAPSLFSFSSLGIEEVILIPGEPAQIVPGVLYYFGLLLICIDLLYGLLRLIQAATQKKYRLKRAQLIFLISGLILTIAGLLLFDVILPILGDASSLSLGPLSSVFFAGACLFAISKYDLLHIKIGAQRGMIYAVMVVTAIGLYMALLYCLSYLSKEITNTNIAFSAGITILLGIFGSQVLERRLRSATDKFFFKEKYDYTKSMRTLTEIANSSTSFEDIVERTKSTLKDIFRAHSVIIHLRGEDLDAGYISAHGHELYELWEDIAIGKERIGYINIGPKISGDQYTDEDVDLLQVCTMNVANSLARVRLFNEVEGQAINLEREVAERTQDLKRAHARERQVISDLSHNLQTPITVLLTKLNSLREDLREDEEIQSFKKSLNDLSAFIYELLTLSRAEQIISTPLEQVDLSHVLNDLTEELKIISAETATSIESEIADGLTIYGNLRSIREALMNISNNSLKYLQTGSRHVSLHAFTSVDQVVIQVQDSGIGIRADDLPYIFDRFYRGKNTDKEIRGSGLGLSIAKRIIEQHSGSITVSSDGVSGTLVTIRLPKRFTKVGSATA